MRAYMLFFFYLALLCLSCSHALRNHYNLGFENTVGDSLINGWWTMSRNDHAIYKPKLDSTTVKEGKYAASISFEGGEPDYCGWGYNLQELFKGDSVTLSGFIKTENVTDGFAGLWVRIDPDIAFNDMSDRGIKGSTDWTEYKITLPLNYEKTKGIAFGGILVGKGKMWIDDFKISIDGKDITELPPVNKATTYEDHEFIQDSRIKIESFDSNKINTLFKVGLLWGFLKYHHPAIAKGEYNWDYELFRLLPKMLKVPESEQDEVLYKWVTNLGSIEKGKDSQNTTYNSVIIKPDLEWITKSGFSEKLQNVLWTIKRAKKSESKHRYVAEGDAGNAVFVNEQPYLYMSYKDDGFRLLSLFRYWNAVQYFFPYRDLIGEDWKAVLKRYIPQFLNNETELQYKLSTIELTRQINDSHAFVIEDYTLKHFFGIRRLPVKLRFINNELIITDYLNRDLALKDGLQIGDVIKKIDHLPVNVLIKELERYVSTSNRWTQLRIIAQNITRTNNRSLQIAVLRNGKEIVKTASCYSSDKLQLGEKVSSYNNSYKKWLKEDVGYIDNGKLKVTDVADAFGAFKNTKGIIIDLRNYPSDYLVYKVPAYLLPSPKPFFKPLIADFNNPGSFYFGNALNTGGENTNTYLGKIVLLIDETTQSSSEFHAMAYRTYHNCTVVGTNSAGADGDITEIILPGGLKTYFSGIGIYYPNGSRTQRVGLVPDIVARPTITDIKNGKDVVLEKAIQLISK